MPRNSDIIIVDTSALILLNKFDELELGRTGANVVITSTVQNEFGETISEWIVTTDPENHHYQDILKMDLDEGEASAILYH